MCIRDRPNPHSGRLLRSQLLAAGLEVDPDIGSSALVLPDGAFRGGGMMAVSYTHLDVYKRQRWSRGTN